MKLYITLTGGGMGTAFKFTESGGTSSWFEGSSIPYGMSSTTNLLRETLGSTKIHGGKFCSERAASHLATAGFKKLQSTGVHGESIMSIGVTSSLFCKGQRDGRESRSFVSILFSVDGEVDNLEEYVVNLNHYVREVLRLPDDEKRITEEKQIGLFISNVVSEFSKLSISNPSEFKEWALDTMDRESGFYWGSLKINKIKYYKHPKNKIPHTLRRNLGVFCGSFDPLHEGHLEIAKNYQSTYPNNKVIFNIARQHIFKDTLLSPFEVVSRASAIRSNGYEVYSSNSGLMKDLRSELLFEDSHLIMGKDTFDKIDEASLYNLGLYGVNVFLFNRKTQKELDFVDPLSYTQPQIKNISSTQIRNKGYEF